MADRSFPLLDAPEKCARCGAPSAQPLHLVGDGVLAGCHACGFVWASPDEAASSPAARSALAAVESLPPGPENDRLGPAKDALREWGARRREELGSAPPPPPPKGLARLSASRRQAHQDAVYERKHAKLEPLDMPLLDPARECPCCGGTELKPLHVQRNPRRRIARVDNLVLTGCRRCGIAFAHPLPTAEEMEAYYSGEGAAEGWEDRLDEHEDDQDALMATKHETYRRQLERLGPHIGGAAGDGRRVLDFGCGLGAWLDVLQDSGWETEGLEPGAEQREVAARRHRMITDLPTEPRYDLIILNHVLEHLLDPVETLKQLRACANEGAHLYASSPDLGRLPEHGKLSYVINGVHIMSFTAESMSAVLGLAGWHAEPLSERAQWDLLDARPGMRLRAVATANAAVQTHGEPLTAAEQALDGRATS